MAAKKTLKFRTLLSKAGVTPEDIWRETGVSLRSIARAQAGTRLSLDATEKIAKMLGMTIDAVVASIDKEAARG